VAQAKTIWIVGPLAVVVAIAATLLVRFLGLLLIDVPTSFPPLAGPGPTIFFTVVSGAVASGVYARIRRVSARADTTFRWVALAVLLLSFAPDLWLLSEGAAEAFPGATPGAVGILMAMHVAAAAAIVGVLTGGVGE